MVTPSLLHIKCYAIRDEPDIKVKGGKFTLLSGDFIESLTTDIPEYW
jgi:hypothetical protein